jgi:hypothetical protein
MNNEMICFENLFLFFQNETAFHDAKKLFSFLSDQNICSVNHGTNHAFAIRSHFF